MDIDGVSQILTNKINSLTYAINHMDNDDGAFHKITLEVIRDEFKDTLQKIGTTTLSMSNASRVSDKEPQYTTIINEF